VPVAFFGVPNTDELAAVLEAEVLLAEEPPLVALLVLLELLDPQPAAISPVAAIAAAMPSHRERFICADLLWLCLSVEWIGEGSGR
jgi:hypothetical protein